MLFHPLPTACCLSPSARTSRSARLLLLILFHISPGLAPCASALVADSYSSTLPHPVSAARDCDVLCASTLITKLFQKTLLSIFICWQLEKTFSLSKLVDSGDRCFRFQEDTGSVFCHLAFLPFQEDLTPKLRIKLLNSHSIPWTVGNQPFPVFRSFCLLPPKSLACLEAVCRWI